MPIKEEEIISVLVASWSGRENVKFISLRRAKVIFLRIQYKLNCFVSCKYSLSAKLLKTNV